MSLDKVTETSSADGRTEGGEGYSNPPRPARLPAGHRPSSIVQQLLVPEAVLVLEREGLGAQLLKGGNHTRVGFRALMEVELAKGTDASAADQQRRRDLN